MTWMRAKTLLSKGKVRHIKMTTTGERSILATWFSEFSGFSGSSMSRVVAVLCCVTAWTPIAVDGVAGESGEGEGEGVELDRAWIEDAVE